MNISLDQAHKSAANCWRHLLRKLDDLPSLDTVDVKDAQTDFVKMGATTQDGLKVILEFLLSDMPVDIQTREEFFCANIEDVLALNLLTDFPKHVFEKVKDPTVVAQIEYAQQYKNELFTKLASGLDTIHYDRGALDATGMIINNLHNTLFTVSINYNEYLQWISDKIARTSVEHCQLLVNTSNRILQQPENSVTVDTSTSFAQRIEQQRPEHTSVLTHKF